MGRVRRRLILPLAVLALVAASCSDDDAETTSSTDAPATTATPTTAAPTTTSTTTTTVPEETTTSSTTTTVPSAPLLVREGDRNETVETVQFLLNCGGADLTVDGVFGPGTRAAVEAAQERLGVTVDGVAGDQTISALSRACSDPRRLEGDGVFTLVGNADLNDAERYAFALVAGTTVAADVTDGTGLTLTLTEGAGAPIEPQDRHTWVVEASGDYLLEVAPDSGTMNFAIELELSAPEPEVGEWVLATDGITYGDTELAIGDDAQTVIDRVFEFLGHGVRGNYDEFDTDWYTIDEPSPIGLRGVLIEGLAFLFYGPHPDQPNIPETLQRIRFEGSSDDAQGRPRPDDYVTTSEGITVGDTLIELQAAYGDGVSPGSNDDEYYYRTADAGGELCFYFGAEEPGELATITEIATECRD